jgi:ABC-2 type transporter
VSRTQVLANTTSSVCILIFGTVAGFMPGFDSIPVILRWLSWVTPASYGFEGMMINEFVGRNLSMAVISNENSTTTEIGTLEGTQWLSIMSLPRSNWTSYQGLKGFDVFMILVLAVVLDLAGCYYVERNREWYFQQIRRPQRKAVSVGFQDKEKKSKNNAVYVVDASKPEAASELDNKNAWPTTLIAKDTCYYVPFKRAPNPKRLNMQSLLGPCLVRCFGKKKGNGDKEEKPIPRQSDNSELQLLTSVNARFACGRMTALMGTSGAGSRYN